MIDKALLQVPFEPGLGGAEEVEQVRVAGGLLYEVGVGLRQGAADVRDRLAGPLVQAPVDLEGEDVATPPTLQRSNRDIGPCCREGAHVLEVAGRVPARLREPLLRSADSLSMTLVP